MTSSPQFIRATKFLDELQCQECGAILFLTKDARILYVVFLWHDMTETNNKVVKQHNRPTKATLEHNLNEVYRLMIADMPNRDIMQQLQLPECTFRRYVQMIRQRNITDQLAKRQEYFLVDLFSNNSIKID